MATPVLVPILVETWGERASDDEDNDNAGRRGQGRRRAMKTGDEDDDRRPGRRPATRTTTGDQDDDGR
jgi:hypothetical protein